MNKKRSGQRWPDCGIVFQSALTPLEAAVLPAKEREAYGVLRMIRRAGEEDVSERQRAKIWVR